MGHTAEPIKFPFSPVDENVLILGGTGHGKTTRGKWVLSQIPTLPYVVLDVKDNFAGFGKTCKTTSDLEYGQMILQASDKTYNGFIEFSKWVLQQNNLVILWDELQQYLKKQVVIPEFESIIMSKRNDGISNVFIFTTTSRIPNYIFDNTRHCFAYKVNGEAAIKWLHGYIGDKAWLLVPQDKRRPSLPEAIRLHPNLTKHSCVYRDQEAPEAQVVWCECEHCKNEYDIINR